MYYKARDLVNGIYISEYNIMFQWNDFENQVYFEGWKKKVLKRLFTEKESYKLEPGSSDKSHYYKQTVEKHLVEHNFAEIVKVRIDPFEFAYDVYDVISNYLTNHEEYKVDQEYVLTHKTAIFTLLPTKDAVRNV